MGWSRGLALQSVLPHSVKHRRRFTVILRETLILVAALGLGTLADVYFGAPFLIGMACLTPVVLIARRHGTSAGLAVALAASVLSLSLHVSVERRPLPH